ncbi:MAG: hypothetical protein FJ297_18755 [Planctomycetes bacterium]|nr:hypothetical protein [Planctomycetota bacterium]
MSATLTRIAVANFKGIKDEVAFDLKPITLLFGPNSGGKSTLIHAIHYANEIFARRNLDADTTLVGGPLVDLGGYRNFLHHGADHIRISLGLTFDEHDLSLPNPSLNPSNASDLQFTGSACIDVTIRRTDAFASPFVSKCSFDVDNKLFATIISDGSICQFAIDSRHPRVHIGWGDIGETFNALLRQLLDDSHSVERASSHWDEPFFHYSIRHESPRPTCALPHLQLLLPLPFWVTPISDCHTAFTLAECVVSAFTIGIARAARDCLSGFRHLGPLRTPVPRTYSPPRSPDSSRWASGLAAWDELQTCPDTFVEEVSDWLAKRLKSGYCVRRKKYREVDETSLVDGDLEQMRSQSPLRRTILTRADSDTELAFNDVGVGISQLLPVVVTSLEGHDRIIAIEQPELHIHPRLQAEIGDLFVAASQERRHCFLIETHSEHCILRLLRRIRETSNGGHTQGFPLMSDDVVVYHISNDKYCTRARRIDVDRNGDFVQPWPDDFFEIDFYERFGS